MHTQKSGFTLLELLIVVAILGIVLSVVMVGYGTVVGDVNVKKTQRHAEQVTVFIEQLKLLDVPYDEVARRLNSHEEFDDYTFAEKVIGSRDYVMIDLRAGSVDVGNCDTSKAVYKFLDILDGPGKTPVAANTIINNVANTSDAVHCTSNPYNISLSVRVNDDNVWWCGRPKEGRYLSTVASGTVRPSCADQESDTRGVSDASAIGNLLFLKTLCSTYPAASRDAAYGKCS